MPESSKIGDIQTVVRAITSYSDLPWIDAWSDGQIRSKLWILDELAKIRSQFSCIYVMGGWLGVLPWLLLNDGRFSIDTLRSFDIDPVCEPAADKLNINDKINSWKFKAVTLDVTAMVYSPDGYYNFIGIKANGQNSKPRPEKPDCIINTSCDHFDNIAEWIKSLPDDTLLVLQNTNAVHDDTHVNCVNNIDDFVNQVNLRNIIYSGTLDIGDWKRFMLIGKK